MKFFMSLLISGLVLGGTYGLIALGYSLIYKASGLMNFAMGDVLTLGAFIGWTFAKVLGLPYFVAMLLTMLVMFFFGIILGAFLPFKKIIIFLIIIIILL